MNRVYRYIFLLILSFSSWQITAQIGGDSNFEFLSMSSSARSTAMGGTVLSVSDGDIALAYQNVAIMDSTFHRQLAFNHNFHFAGISNGLVSYGHRLENQDINLIAALQYVNYGDFQAFDNIGQTQGAFNARDIALAIGASRQMNERIRLGAMLKFANSSYESYGATAMLLDLGVYYQTGNAGASWGLILKNMGFQLSQFNDEEKSVPFDLQLAYSKKLQHLPFRFSIVAHHLAQWDIRYDDPDRQVDTGLFGEVSESSDFSKSIDNLFRHLIFNGEFLFGKNETVRLRFGYNHLLKKELEVSSFRSFGGFSFGLGVRIKKFRLDLGRGNYHLAGGITHLGLAIDLDSYFRKI